MPKPAARITPRCTGIVITSYSIHYTKLYEEGAKLYAEKMLQHDVTVGLSLSGALVPAGLGMSCIVPLMRAGFVDWIVSTGANLYHDVHFGLGMNMHAGSPFLDDTLLQEEGVVRIYDILFAYEVLLDTDAFFRRVSYNFV